MVLVHSKQNVRFIYLWWHLIICRPPAHLSVWRHWCFFHGNSRILQGNGNRNRFPSSEEKLWNPVTIVAKYECSSQNTKRFENEHPVSMIGWVLVGVVAIQAGKVCGRYVICFCKMNPVDLKTIDGGRSHEEWFCWIQPYLKTHFGKDTCSVTSDTKNITYLQETNRVGFICFCMKFIVFMFCQILWFMSCCTENHQTGSGNWQRQHEVNKQILLSGSTLWKMASYFQHTNAAFFMVVCCGGRVDLGATCPCRHTCIFFLRWSHRHHCGHCRCSQAHRSLDRRGQVGEVVVSELKGHKDTRVWSTNLIFKPIISQTNWLLSMSSTLSFGELHLSNHHQVQDSITVFELGRLNISNKCNFSPKWLGFAFLPILKFSEND